LLFSASSKRAPSGQYPVGKDSKFQHPHRNLDLRRTSIERKLKSVQQQQQQQQQVIELAEKISLPCAPSDRCDLLMGKAEGREANELARSEKP
jgi:hypothetical protein